VHRFDHNWNSVRKPEANDAKNRGLRLELKLGGHGGIQIVRAMEAAFEDPSRSESALAGHLVREAKYSPELLPDFGLGDVCTDPAANH